MKECAVKRISITASCCGCVRGCLGGDRRDDGDGGRWKGRGRRQLLDVTEQVGGIQKKMNELLAHGRWATAGNLLAGADCGYGDAAPVFALSGDLAMYALAPQGDLAVSDGWTLNKQTTVSSGGDPFSGAGQSLLFAKGAEAQHPRCA